MGDFVDGNQLLIDGSGNLIQLVIDYDMANTTLLTKYDSLTGASIWSTRLFDDNYGNNVEGYSMDFTSDNNIVISGSVPNGDQNGQWKLYLAKINRDDGSINWQKTIGDVSWNSTQTGMCVKIGRAHV